MNNIALLRTVEDIRMAKDHLFVNNYFWGLVSSPELTPQELRDRIETWVYTVSTYNPRLAAGLWLVIESGCFQSDFRYRTFFLPGTRDYLNLYNTNLPFVSCLRLDWAEEVAPMEYDEYFVD